MVTGLEEAQPRQMTWAELIRPPKHFSRDVRSARMQRYLEKERRRGERFLAQQQWRAAVRRAKVMLREVASGEECIPWGFEALDYTGLEFKNCTWTKIGTEVAYQYRLGSFDDWPEEARRELKKVMTDDDRLRKDVKNLHVVVRHMVAHKLIAEAKADAEAAAKPAAA